MVKRKDIKKGPLKDFVWMLGMTCEKAEEELKKRQISYRSGFWIVEKVRPILIDGVGQELFSNIDSGRINVMVKDNLIVDIDDVG